MALIFASALLGLRAGPLLAQSFKPVLPAVGGLIDHVGRTDTRFFVTTQIGTYSRDFAAPRWSLLEDAAARASRGKVDGYGNTVVLNIGGFGKVRISSDNGVHWSEVRISEAAEKVREWGAQSLLCKHGLFLWAQSDVIPADVKGAFRTLDSGKTWTRFMAGHRIWSLVDMGRDIAVSIPESGIHRIELLSGRTERISGSLGSVPEPAVLAGSGKGFLLAMQARGDLHRYSEATGQWSKVMPYDSAGGYFDVTVQGDTAFALVPGPLGSRFHRSTDGGVTWSQGKDVAGDWGYPHINHQDTLYGMSEVGMRKLVWPTAALLPDSAGRHAGLLASLYLFNGDIHSYPEGYRGLWRTRDMGRNWEPVDTLLPRVAFAQSRGHQVFTLGPTLVRYVEGRGKPDTLDSPLYIGWIRQYVNAGSRLYARGTAIREDWRDPPEPDRMVVWSKTFPYWSRPVALPFKGIDFIAAEEAQILAKSEDTLAFSADEGATWSRLSGLPFSHPNSIHREAGKWLASSEKGLFVSGNPREAWSLLAFPSKLVHLRTARGARLVLLEDSTRVHLSSDGGRTWEFLPIPFPNPWYAGYELSDDRLCISGNQDNGLIEAYCRDLAVAVAIGPGWTKVSATGPSRHFDGRRILLQGPAKGKGSGAARQVDGRLFRPSALLRP